MSVPLRTQGTFVLFFLAKRTNVPYTGDMKPTKPKKDILQSIATLQAREGYSPTVRDICNHLGRSSAGSMHKDLESLEKSGFLEKIPGKSRTWQLTPRAWDLIGKPSAPSIPLVGRIAAGTPILAEQNREDDLPIDPRLFGAEDAFAVRVRGDSMIEAHIRDGDLAILRPQEEAEDGQIVAVQIEGIEPEATLKILRRRNGTVELQPANAEYKPLVFHGAERSRVTILGRLVGVIRPRP